MSLITNYQDFFCSSFFIECRKCGLKTIDLLSFVSSLVGVKNFIRNHPVPILEYYWESNVGSNELINLAKKMDVFLKEMKVVCDKKEIDPTNKKVFYVLPCNTIKGPNCYGGIDAVKGSLMRARILVDLTSSDIIQNEALWEKCDLIASSSQRHSSDEFEYHSIFKTGWAYLSENLDVKLDWPLISYLKDRNIDLKKQQFDEYAGFRFGVSPVSKEKINALMAFRNHPIDENIVSVILNDPIQWEGIFYDQEFCNISILKYVSTLVPNLEEHFFDLPK